MNIRRTLWFWVSIVILSACGITSEQKSNFGTPDQVESLRLKTREVADYFDKTGDHDFAIIGSESKEEAIYIEAKLTDNQIADLKNKFGEDNLKFINTDPFPQLLNSGEPPRLGDGELTFLKEKNKEKQEADPSRVKLLLERSAQLDDFKQEVDSILDAAMHQQFPNDRTGDKFFDQAVWYYDFFHDVNDIKLVFLVDKADTKQMKALRKELEEKLGDKVVFKKATKNPKIMSDMVDSVSDFINMKFKNDRSVSSIVWSRDMEKVFVEVYYLDQEFADEIKAKFGSDNVSVIEVEKEWITLS